MYIYIYILKCIKMINNSPANFHLKNKNRLQRKARLYI